MDIKSRPSRSPIPRICTSSSSCLSMPSSRRSDHQAPAPHPGPQLLRYQCSNRNRDATGDANHSSYLWLKEMTQHGSVHRGLGHKGFTNESTFLHLRVSSHDSRPAEADKSKIYQKTCLSQLVPLQALDFETPADRGWRTRVHHKDLVHKPKDWKVLSLGDVGVSPIF